MTKMSIKYFFIMSLVILINLVLFEWIGYFYQWCIKKYKQYIFNKRKRDITVQYKEWKIEKNKKKRPKHDE